MNGTLGTVAAIDGRHVTIRLDRDERQPHLTPRVVVVDNQQYPYLEHGYAATIHKAQGVTVDRCYVLASTYLDRHATYVALSRHRESVDIFYSREAFAQERDLLHALSRERGKDVSLDYGTERSFASVRGIEAQHAHESLDGGGFEIKAALLARAVREDSLAAFKARYEKTHPDMAHLHREMVSPSEEKQFAAAVEQLTRLHQQFERGEIDKKVLVEAYINGLEKQPKMLHYVQQKCSVVYEKIRQMVREQQTRDRGLE